MQQLPGVQSAVSGFMGGTTHAPTYEDVVRTDTGHAETVRVQYDPNQISYEAIIRRFFEIHDPTQINRQGPDVGTQYRSAVFYSSLQEKASVEELIQKLRSNGYDVVTQLEPATTFYEAESYHQEYYKKNGQEPYCHVPVDRFTSRNPLEASS